jgi:hypothetical protein
MSAGRFGGRIGPSSLPMVQTTAAFGASPGMRPLTLNATIPVQLMCHKPGAIREIQERAKSGARRPGGRKCNLSKVDEPVDAAREGTYRFGYSQTELLFMYLNFAESDPSTPRPRQPTRPAPGSTLTSRCPAGICLRSTSRSARRWRITGPYPAAAHPSRSIQSTEDH